MSCLLCFIALAFLSRSVRSHVINSVVAVANTILDYARRETVKDNFIVALAAV